MLTPNRKLERKKRRAQHPRTRDRNIIDRRADALNREAAEVLEYQSFSHFRTKRPRTRKSEGGGETAVKMKPAQIHPGVVLLEEFLKPLGLSQNRLALSIGVSPHRINQIVRGKRGVSADTALRLARFFGTTPRFWLGLQTDHDLQVAADALGQTLEREIKPFARMTGS